LPHESAEKLVERLLVLTLMLESAELDDLTPLLSERSKVVQALEAAERGPEIRDLIVRVMQAEQRALQRFAAARAEAARDLDRRSNGRKLPTTYSSSRRSGFLIDAAG
jgi:hypothetical protein